MRSLISIPVALIIGWFYPATILAQPDDEGIVEGDSYQGDEDGESYLYAEEGEGVQEEPPAADLEEVDIDYFFDKLAPYGEWIWTPEYGWVWRPLDVWEDWRPYSYGRWVYTRFGWTWSSYFPWGWATFHYGRWASLNYIGWVWVPGTVWAPAWVMWRYSGGYVGWAPLLAGYDYWFGWAYYPVYYSHWTFVSWNYLCDSHPHHHYVPRREVRDVFHHTYFPRRCRESSSQSCQRGLSQQLVSRQLKAPIKAARVENLAGRMRAADPAKASLGVDGDTLRIFRPRFKEELQRLSPASPVPGQLPGRRDLGPARGAPSKRLPSAEVAPGDSLPTLEPGPATRATERSPSRLKERRRPLPGKFIYPPQPNVNRRSIPRPAVEQPTTHPTTQSAPKAGSQPTFRPAPQQRNQSLPSAPGRSSSSSGPSGRSFKRR